ncbi:hypothetical protein [Yoonia maritima]|uniref:capsular polysaccharide export protein, LipB/KpsS family n=1 Tax=Yoonia maritima TaxID=1435347 RepID=UPI000D0EB0E1|nr:hypothetical protein [Yoonia maritima]
MIDENTVTFYLSPKLRRQAERGNHNFISQVCAVLERTGLKVAYDGNDELGRLNAMARQGRGLFLMDDPVDERGLSFRKTYIYPFWHIEKQSKRWEWPVAQKTFDTSAVDHTKAKTFHHRWREKLFAGETRKDGFVYMPLQGRLTVRRSFQFCSPIEMIKATLQYDPDRKIIATLHPSENYSDDDLTALKSLVDANGRLSIQHRSADKYLHHCDYIVTQNSSLGFHGYFLEKPVILFGKTDFHHIGLNVHEMGVVDAFAAQADHNPDYAAYLFWFLQQQAINAGRPETQETIRKVLQGHGWSV